MKMHLLPCGRLKMRKSIFLPAAERSETIELPVSSALLRHGQANVLFDTGCHPSVPENPEGRWGGLAKLMVPIMQPGEHVLTGLAGLGLKPDDIDVVINSHLHPDHCGCNAFFRKATFLCHAEELAAARAPEQRGQRLSRRRMGPADAGRRDQEPTRRVRRRPHRAPAPARPHAGLDRRADATRPQRHVPARRRHREPARDARHRHHPAQHLECRCAGRNRWTRSAASRPRAPPSCAATMRGSGTACARGSTPMTELRANHRA